MLKRGLFGLAVLLAPAAAAAQPLSGPYLSGDIGADVAPSAMKSGSAARVDFDTGPAGSLAAGWRFGDGFRAELDGTYVGDSIDGIFTPNNATGQLARVTDSGGLVSTYAVTANALYDIPVRGWIRPYVGFGAGYGWLNFSEAHGVGYGTLRLAQNNTYTSYHTLQFGTGGAFAYQARVGFSIPVRQAPGLALTAEYRFLGTARAEVPVTRVAIGNNLVNGQIPSSSERYGFSAGDNVLAIGLRYDFGAR